MQPRKKKKGHIMNPHLFMLLKNTPTPTLSASVCICLLVREHLVKNTQKLSRKRGEFKKSCRSQRAEKPNEGYKQEMAPEEENRAQPKMREQIVDLLSVCCSCCTCTRSLCLRVAPPHPNTTSLLSSCSRRFEITSHLFQGWKNRRDFVSSIQSPCLHPSKMFPI